MKFHYEGRFNGDENSLPQREQKLGDVPFKEPSDMQKLSKLLIIANIVVYLTFWSVGYFVNGHNLFAGIGFWIGWICLFPHEILHAICFKEDVYMYTNLKQGMLFVVGTEDISKTRFCFMSLLPNVVFGFIPFIIYMINPSLVILGELGVFSIAAGVGDYLNVYNALTQMPNGAKTYVSGMHSYWYMPEKINK